MRSVANDSSKVNGFGLRWAVQLPLLTMDKALDEHDHEIAFFSGLLK